MAQESGTVEAVLAGAIGRNKPSVMRQIRTLIRRQPLGTIGFVIAVFFAFVAVAGPLLYNFDYTEFHKKDPLLAPSSIYWFGTDNLGMDVYSRVIRGARIAMIVGLVSPLIIQTLGAAIGIPSAFFGGKFDLVVQRFVDAWNSFPTIILALALVTVLGASLMNVIIAIGVTRGSGVSRVIRSQALRVKEMDYVMAARALGAGDLRIMIRHIFPQCAAVMLVLVSVEIPGAIVAEASLSYLGLGTPPPEPSWGAMMSGPGRRFLLAAPWIAIFPGICLSIVVFGFNMLGDAVRDVLDPRLRGSRG